MVNGKVVGSIPITKPYSVSTVFAEAVTMESFKKRIAGRKIVDIVFIPERIFNVITKEISMDERKSGTLSEDEYWDMVDDYEDNLDTESDN